MKFREYLIENKSALKWVSNFILSSKLSKIPSNEIIKYLRKSVKKKSYKLYRGIGIIKKRVPSNKIDEINNLKIGDELPDYLLRKSRVSSYTKNKSVARYYSEGKMSIIVQANVNSSDIIADLEVIPEIIKNEKQDILDEDDFDYMKSDKEVIIKEPIKSIIIDIKGRI